jgi:hypothetical protein
MRSRLDLEPHHSSDQLSLFSSSRDEFAAEVLVSCDEMSAWHQKNWLSFDPLTMTEFNEPERMEVLFLKALAHSGLSDSYIERLLSAGLRKPYRYDPGETFFSFADFHWITIPPEPDPAAIAVEYIEDLADQKEWDELREFQKKIAAVLAGEEPNA